MSRISDSEKRKEDWMNTKWRPMMGWMYMGVCITDFVIFPILWSVIQAIGNGQVNIQWQPITLQGAGLFHIAMGAVLGLAAYGRTQEKLGGANNGGIQLPSNVGSTYVPPPPAPQQGGYYQQPPSSPTTNIVTQTYGAPASFNAAPQGVTSINGKPAPMQPDFPEI
jgi:hypothetical protein